MWFILKLLGMVKTVIGFIVAAVQWLFADWRRLAGFCIILAFALMIFNIFSLKDSLADETARADMAEADFAKLEDQHYKFVKDVQDQTEKAQRLDLANAQRVEERIEQINERTTNVYENQLANTRNALDVLRRRISAATSARSESGIGETNMPSNYAARCTAFGYANCDELLAALPQQLAEAENNTGRLIALQEWARGVISIDLDGPEDEIHSEPD